MSVSPSRELPRRVFLILSFRQASSLASSVRIRASQESGVESAQYAFSVDSTAKKATLLPGPAGQYLYAKYGGLACGISFVDSCCCVAAVCEC
ncbi:hypothetical protein BDZ88DRAFT_209329 [Geranomyces variabilis]|nr:hypothetical protein BDZ88DRAFT_209329 [Geranomyces variabilis]